MSLHGFLVSVCPRLVLVSTVLGMASCVRVEQTFGSERSQRTREVASALMRALTFERGDVVPRALPDPANTTAALEPRDQVVELEPGLASIMAIEVNAHNGEAISATLMQIETLDDQHIRVPADADSGGEVELRFEVMDDVCASLCDIVHEIELVQAVELDESGASRRVTIRLALDCRVEGRRRFCDDVDGNGDDDDDDDDEPREPARDAGGGREDARVADAGARDAGAATDAAVTRPDSGGAGGSSGRGGSQAPMCGAPSGELCVNDGDINLDCGTFGEQPPTSGFCAASGECCHRASNKARERALCADEPLELEYRVAYAAVRNQPTTLGDPILIASSAARLENEQQSMLFRWRAPRAAGSEVSGPGEVTIGPGRYNCDGTYSFYGDSAAPAKPGVNVDRTRWSPATSRMSVDVNQSGVARMNVAFEDDAIRARPMITPFLDDYGKALDWELVTEGFRFVQLDVSGQGRDCIGQRSGFMWMPGGRFETYMPLQDNDLEIVTLIAQTHCQLAAFGILPMAMKTTTLCFGTPRCVPRSSDCAWKKLPDSLCPRGASERALFGCHLGDRQNLNAEAGYPAQVDCTDAAPRSPADPAIGSPGQCCDPLGASSTLPACNAYRMVYDFVAAAAEITDTLTNTLQQKCGH